MKKNKYLFKKVISIFLVTFIMVGTVNVGGTISAATNEIKLECENVWESSSATKDIRSTDPNTSGGKFIFMQPTTINQTGHWVQFQLSVPTLGKYEIYLGTKDDSNRGIFKAELSNGTVLSSVDLYSSTVAYNEHKLGEYIFSEQTAMLKLTCTGGNTLSTKKNGIAADYIRLVPVIEPLVEVKLQESSLKVLETNFDSTSASAVNQIRAISGTDGGYAYFFQPLAERYINFSFNTPKAGTYEMYLGTKNDYTRGIYSIKVDGNIIGEVDGYGPNVATERKVGDVTFDGSLATSQINFVGAGKNQASTSSMYGIVIDYIRFVPKAEGQEEISEIIDTLNSYGTYSEAGTGWSDGTLLNYDNTVKTRVSKTIGNFATFSCYPPDLAAAKEANYDVYAWIPGNNINGTSVKYTISTAIGLWAKTIDQKLNGGTWLKLSTVTATGETAFEVKLYVGEEKESYATAIKLVKTTNNANEQQKPGTGTDTTSVAVLVNQSGYDTDKSKRATVVNTPDGTPFYIKSVSTKEVVYSNVVSKGIIDFTELKPSEKTDYFIECNGAISYTFTIANNWIQKVSVLPALDFMDESRHDAWLYGEMTGSMGWRDSHQFSFELNSLVLQYMANPSLYENLPYDIYRANDTLFDSLKIQNEPDIIWLMKYGMERYYDFATNKGKQLHGLIKEQMAYVLYIYPYISKYMSEEDYIKYRDFLFKEWTNPNCNFQKYQIPGEKHNLLETQTVVGTIKGSFPPGHSIVPNLMMYEIANRDGMANPDQYFDAAYRNADYVLNNFDISSTRYSKSQRMSEHVTMENLTFFQEKYPNSAPQNLKAEIERWADIIIARSNNLWDMRMASAIAAGDPKDYWTGAAFAVDDGQWSSIMNEPGNEAGVQAIMYAAARIVDDQAKAKRLKEIGDASIDDMYGRNPYGRPFFYNYTDIEGLDNGWFSKHGNEAYNIAIEASTAGYGKLGGVTGRIDASPKEWAYPYNPNSDAGYVEGWVAFNTAWNTSLAYSAADDIEVYVNKNVINAGETIKIKIRAAANMDYEKQETIEAKILNKTTGEVIKIDLIEENNDSLYFIGEYIPTNETTTLEISYGIDVFKKDIDVFVKGDGFIDITAIEIDKEELSVNAGLSEKVSISNILPENASVKDVIWQSSNTDIVVVDNEGLVYGIKPGTSTVTAISVINGSVTASCKVTVLEAIPMEIVATIEKGIVEQDELTSINIAGIKYSDNTIKTNLDDAIYTFFAENRELIYVNTLGEVKGKRFGTTNVIITTKYDGKDLLLKLPITVVEKVGESTKLEFESLARSASPDSVGLDALSGTLITFKPTKVDEWITFSNINLQSGVYKVSLRAKTYPEYGKYQMYIDENTMVGNVINYYGSSSGLYLNFELGNVNIGASGAHSVKFLCVGTQGTKYNMALDYITFTKVVDPYPPFVNLISLQNAIIDAESKYENAINDVEMKYAQELIDTFKVILADAKVIYYEDEPIQSQVDSMVIQLSTAIEELIASGKPVVHKEELQKIYEENKDRVEIEYTPKTWCKLRNH